MASIKECRLSDDAFAALAEPPAPEHGVKNSLRSSELRIDVSTSFSHSTDPKDNWLIVEWIFFARAKKVINIPSREPQRVALEKAVQSRQEG
jgi:hypothetical protein